MLPDGSDARMRRLSYIGPGAALVAVAHERVVRGSRRGRIRLPSRVTRPVLTLREADRARALAHAQVILLDAGARLFSSGK
jgi:hypothetical protein